MNIVFAASECTPFAKTGGLADVLGALPQALAARHKVTVFLPYYPWKMRPLEEKGLAYTKTVSLLDVPLGGKTLWAQIRVLEKEKNLQYCFIEFDRYFDRPNLYDWNGEAYSDNGERFLFFSRSVMQGVLKMNLRPDILHLNDWQSALCAAYLTSSHYRSKPQFANTKSVLTLHNVGYQGVFPASLFPLTELEEGYFRYDCLEYYGNINFLKGGIACAHEVNTVSPTYAREILGEQGEGLQGALQHCYDRGKLRGILNGIDVKEWDPASDPALPVPFSAADLKGKKEAKKALLAHFNLPYNEGKTPLFGVISRLASQKGLDILAGAMEELLAANENMQFIIIGTGDPILEERYKSLAERYPDKVGFYCGMAPKGTAHLLEGGSDFFLMPSRFEPCGLSQMIAMRYGTLPIVRHTGGLADTVVHFVEEEKPIKGTGIHFYDLTIPALRETIRYGARLYFEAPRKIRSMRIAAMKKDFSWDHTGEEYEEMYNDAHK